MNRTYADALGVDGTSDGRGQTPQQHATATYNKWTRANDAHSDFCKEAQDESVKPGVWYGD